MGSTLRSWSGPHTQYPHTTKIGRFEGVSGSWRLFEVEEAAYSNYKEQLDCILILRVGECVIPNIDI